MDTDVDVISFRKEKVDVAATAVWAITRFLAGDGIDTDTPNPNPKNCGSCGTKQKRWQNWDRHHPSSSPNCGGVSHLQSLPQFANVSILKVGPFSFGNGCRLFLVLHHSSPFGENSGSSFVFGQPQARTKLEYLSLAKVAEFTGRGFHHSCKARRECDVLVLGSIWSMHNI
jgi:hypothetical protein